MYVRPATVLTLGAGFVAGWVVICKAMDITLTPAGGLFDGYKMGCRLPRVARRHLALCLLIVSLAVPATAQQVYIKNKPFAGQVVKESGGLWVDLKSLEQALDFEARLEAEGASINGRLVRTMRYREVVFVSLSQVAAAVGASVRENPEFGTVDVHMVVRPKSATAGLEVDPSLARPTSAPGEKIETAGFIFVVPQAMQVSRDPRLIKAFLEAGGPPIRNSDFKFDALVFYKGDAKFTKGAAVFSWFNREIPKGMESEQTLLAYQSDLATVLLDDMGVELVKAPEVVQSGDQRFLLAAGVERKPPHDGMLLLLRIDPKKKRFYQVITANITQAEEAPTSDFIEFLSTITTK